jgi:hypothetical protein
MIRNENVRFDMHIDIEVSYEILQLEIPKLVLILYNPACFQKGLFGGNFEQKHPWSFRVKKIKLDQQNINQNIKPLVRIEPHKVPNQFRTKDDQIYNQKQNLCKHHILLCGRCGSCKMMLCSTTYSGLSPKWRELFGRV